MELGGEDWEIQTNIFGKQKKKGIATPLKVLFNLKKEKTDGNESKSRPK
jgi:hypothetical protein